MSLISVPHAGRGRDISQIAQYQNTPARARRSDDVKFIGALNGCYALSGRRADDQGGIPVYACRLCSISPYQAVLVAPVIAAEGETVAAHFRDFGLLRARVTRVLPDGFVIDFDLDEQARDKLAAKIRWKKSNVLSNAVDQREHPRIMPRQPRTVLTMADGTRVPCFVIDISQSGAAVSAQVLPGRGTPLALGALVGRVVRRLDVGFAVEFIAIQPLADLEQRMSAAPDVAAQGSLQA